MTTDDIFADISNRAPIVPVLVVEDVAHAAPLANALADGGAVAVEVTLRTASAIECIKHMKAARSSLLVGAGTVLSEGDIDACAKAGADFLVTPGTPPALAEALVEYGLPSCPGVSTAGESLNLYEMGFDHQKFFPAEASGGVGFLRALSGPLQNISFMPTGGVSIENMQSYLQLPNVFAVGGSWIAQSELVLDNQYEVITSRMSAALKKVC